MQSSWTLWAAPAASLVLACGGGDSTGTNNHTLPDGSPTMTEAGQEGNTASPDAATSGDSTASQGSTASQDAASEESIASLDSGTPQFAAEGSDPTSDSGGQPQADASAVQGGGAEPALDGQEGMADASLPDGDSVMPGGDAAVDDMTPSGTCGVANRYTIPEMPNNQHARRVQQIEDTFAVGAWYGEGSTDEPLLRWLRIDLQNSTHSEFTMDLQPSGAIAVLPMAPEDRALGVGGVDELPTGVLQAGGSEWDYGGPLMPDVRFDMRFSTLLGASLDGQRGLLMVSSRLRMFTPTGDALGELIELESVGDCESILPTSDGLVFSHYDSDSLQLLEFGNDGSVLREHTVVIGDGRECPLLALADNGVAVLTRDTRELYRIPNDGDISVERVPSLGDPPRGFAISGEEVIFVSQQDSGPTITRKNGDTESAFPLDIATFSEQIPTAAGTLVLHSNPSLLDSTRPREIVQITCED